MRVSYSEEQRKISKKDNKRLFTLAITGHGGKGGYTIQGLCNDEQAQKIALLIAESFEWDRV